MAAGGSEGNELPSHPAAKGRVYILEVQSEQHL